jgi:hypothetical protein
LNQSAAVTGVLPVANGGTGQSSLAAGAILLGDATGVQTLGFTTGDALKVVRVNAGETAYELATISGGGGVDSLTTVGNGLSVDTATGDVTLTLDTGVAFADGANTGIPNLSAPTSPLDCSSLVPCYNAADGGATKESLAEVVRAGLACGAICDLEEQTEMASGDMIAICREGVGYKISWDNFVTAMASALGLG